MAAMNVKDFNSRRAKGLDRIQAQIAKVSKISAMVGPTLAAVAASMGDGNLIPAASPECPENEHLALPFEQFRLSAIPSILPEHQAFFDAELAKVHRAAAELAARGEILDLNELRPKPYVFERKVKPRRMSGREQLVKFIDQNFKRGQLAGLALGSAETKVRNHQAFKRLPETTRNLTNKTFERALKASVAYS